MTHEDSIAQVTLDILDYEYDGPGDYDRSVEFRFTISDGTAMSKRRDYHEWDGEELVDLEDPRTMQLEAYRECGTMIASTLCQLLHPDLYDPHAVMQVDIANQEPHPAFRALWDFLKRKHEQESP